MPAAGAAAMCAGAAVEEGESGGAMGKLDRQHASIGEDKCL
jgi:hypothetical protein